MSLTVDVEAQLKEALSKLDVATVERLANLALKSGGLVIANEWKRRAPIKTGTYRRSIHVAGAAEKTPDFEGTELDEPGGCRLTRLLALRWTRRGDKLTVKVGTNIKEPPYPQFLEYGTSRMPPHPSAGPAMDATREEVLKEVGAVLAELVAKELGK